MPLGCSFDHCSGRDSRLLAPGAVLPPTADIPAGQAPTSDVHGRTNAAVAGSQRAACSRDLVFAAFLKLVG
jgi:hypothetical protein